MTAASGSKDTSKATGNTAVPSTEHGDHDKVAMLSLKADGTPDQTPGVEIIGDKEFALAATKEQFKQQAVSVADQNRLAEQNETAVETEQDPTIKAAQEEHEKVAEAAEKAADATVGALFKDDTSKSSDKG